MSIELSLIAEDIGQVVQVHTTNCLVASEQYARVRKTSSKLVISIRLVKNIFFVHPLKKISLVSSPAVVLKVRNR